MSEFSVHRTLGGNYCLILDGDRIAGAKPDYRGNNHVTHWVTEETYGVVDGYETFMCEKCGVAFEVGMLDDWAKARYCPHCGSRTRQSAGDKGEGKSRQ